MNKLLVSMTFDPEVAKEIGVEGAIVLQNIVFWIAKNKANNKHFYENKFWTYNSNKAFLELFPWLTEQSLRTILKKLVDKKYLMKGNFNKLSYDRTLWYCIGENYQMHLLELTNGIVENNKPIPYINTDIKTYKREALKNEEQNTSNKVSSIDYLLDIDTKTVEEFQGVFNCSEKQVRDKGENLYHYIISKGKKYKNHKSLLRNALDKDYGKRKSYLDQIKEEYPDVIIAQ
jgi:hypothetical protein